MGDCELCLREGDPLNTLWRLFGCHGGWSEIRNEVRLFGFFGDELRPDENRFSSGRKWHFWPLSFFLSPTLGPIELSLLAVLQ